MRPVLRDVLIVAVTLTALATPASSQAPDTIGGRGAALRELFGRAVHVSGAATMTTDLYASHGIEQRRPGSAWRMSLSPQASVFGSFSVGVNALVSSEGSDLRQNMSQFGLNPSWSWGAAHIGDFSQPFTPYTLQGVRLRGAGLELRPGNFLFAIQGGRSQRTVGAGLDGVVYERNLYAAQLGYGAAGGNRITLNIVKAKDDVDSVEESLVVIDTILPDTLDDFLQPRVETRPQENLVLGLEGQLALFANIVTVRGEVAGTMLTHDLTSPRASAPDVDLPDFVESLMPTRLSTSGDLAWNVDVAARFRRFGGQVAYEHIGAGYSSLGLPYVIGDRRNIKVGGNVMFFDGRVALQGQVQRQNDNLLDQKLFTTNRDVGSFSIALRPTRATSASIAMIGNRIGNDATNDTLLIDNRTLGLNTNVSIQDSLFARTVTWGVGYGYQLATDGNVLHAVPEIGVHNLSGSMTVGITETVTLTPSVSGVLKQYDGSDSEQDVFLNFRGQGRMLEDRLSVGATVSNSFSQGRDVFTVMANAGYVLPLGVQFSLQARHNSYGAYADRPAFNEQLMSMSLSRAF